MGRNRIRAGAIIAAGAVTAMGISSCGTSGSTTAQNSGSDQATSKPVATSTRSSTSSPTEKPGTVISKRPFDAGAWAGGEWTLSHDPGPGHDFLVNVLTGARPSWFPNDAAQFASPPEWHARSGNLFAIGKRKGTDLSPGKTVTARVDPKSGKIMWAVSGKHDLGWEVPTTNPKGANTVILGKGLYDAQTGEKIGAAPADSVLSTNPLVTVDSEESQVTYYDTAGRPDTSLPSADDAQGLVLPDGSIVTQRRLGDFHPSTEDKSVALVAPDGTVKWKKETDASIVAATADQVILSVASTNMLVALDPATGDKLWSDSLIQGPLADCALQGVFDGYITGDKLVLACEAIAGYDEAAAVIQL